MLSISSIGVSGSWVFLTSLALALVATPLAAVAARATGVIDRPSGLKDHKAPTPYLGGVAIFLAVVLGAGMAAPQIFSREIQAILTASTVVMLLGLLDDVHAFGPGLKFIFQGIASLILVSAGVHLNITALPVWMNILLTFFWILAVTNAFNIIDIMDGLAAGIASLAALGLFIIALGAGRMDLAILSAAVVGGSLGFLVYNAPPASIFMGDCGSQFLGFLLGAVAMGVGYTGENDIALFAPLMILAVPLYDLFFVMVIRTMDGKSPFRGSKDHIALRLRFMGFSTGRTILILYVAAALMGFAAVCVTFAPLMAASGVYLGMVMLVLASTIILSRVEVPKA